MHARGRSPQLLSAPGARWLLGSSLLARLPLAMFSLGILVHTHRLTGSFAVAGLASCAYAVCGGISAPALGRLVDRTGQTRVLVAGSLASAAMLIGLGLLGPGAEPPLLVALAAGAGLTTPPLAACVRTLLPGIAPDPSQLPRLFALESTALELTFVIGPPLVLALGAIWSTGDALIASGVVMVAGAVAFATRPTSRLWRPDLAPSSARRRAGALTSPAIRALVGITLAMEAAFGAAEVGVTATAQHLAGAAAAAPVLALWGGGSLIGGLVVTRRGGAARGVRALVAMLAALAITHGALMLGTGSLVTTGAIILLAGATIAPTTAGLYAMVGRTAPAGTETEAFSWMDAASSAGAAIGAAVAGVLVQDSGPVAAFAFCGAAGLLATTIAVWRAGALDPDGPEAPKPPAAPEPAAPTPAAPVVPATPRTVAAS